MLGAEHTQKQTTERKEREHHHGRINPDGALRPDGRVIDYTTWALGPRRTYHLKIIWED